MVEQDDKPKFENWHRPREALTVLQSAFPDRAVAQHLLIERLKSGAITAISENSTWKGHGAEYQKTSTIEPEMWRQYYREETGFWDSGDLTFDLGYFRGSYSSVSVRYHSIRFDPGGIKKLAATAENRVAPTAVQAAASKVPISFKPEIQKNKGGRPPKSWWQDFWIEMCRLVYAGDIQPEKTQADIERLMHQWVSDHDYKSGETVIKDAAQKLMKALRK